MLLSKAIQFFITARTADGRAPRTIQDYHRVLDPFAAWCADRGITVELLNREQVREYAAHLREHGWSEGTVAIHIRNLRAFLCWLSEEGYTADNLAKALKAPRRIDHQEDPLAPEEIRALIAACQDGSAEGRRDLALILVFLDTGLRIGEMVRLRREDVNFNDENGTAWIRVYAPKTRTYRFVFLGKNATEVLRVYISGRKDPQEALWVGKSKALTAQGIYKAIRRRAEKAGVGRVHPHLFRKSFATHWLDNGGDVERLRVLAGWRSLEMLSAYVCSAVRQLEQAHRRAAPVDCLLGLP